MSSSLSSSSLSPVDPKASNFSSLQDLFDRVSTLVRDTPESSEPATTTQDVKLRLYGLYKHVTCGPCPSTESSSSTASVVQQPSIFQPVARAKYQAWYACRDCSDDVAMWEYIQLVASQEHWVGEKCREWIQQYDDKKIQQLEQAKQKSCNEMIESPQLEKDAESQAKGNADSSNSCVTKEQAIEAKHSFSSSNRSCKPFKQQQQQQRSISWSEKWLGVKPVIPRGHLDISFLDLLYAVAQCFLCAFQCSTSYRYHQLDQSIKNVVTTALKRQQLEDQIVDVVVGLSVRSLLDLYLLARKYPPHSEVIMVPPINIPDMIHVLEHHQLQVVAVDLPLSTDEEQHSVTVAVDVQAVREAISERTVAIVVVHPFGMISASDVTMKQLYKLAQQHRLDLLEDCAECFSGLEGSNQVYLGSPFATVSFFSFGLIKTCTSLGGALALVRQITKDPDEHSSTTTLSSVATKMSRLQFSLYQQTPPREYAWKVIKSLFICFATCHPVVYGIIISCCQRLGLDFDAIAVRFTRSFVIAADELETAQGQKQFVAKLRKRPSNPLMSLLHRRLRNSGAKSVVTRTIRCHQLMQQLTKLRVDGLILPPKCDSGNNTWWLYPINSCLLSPDKMCQLLRQHGFDATRGMSQLNCIVKTSPSIRGACPKAVHFMEQVIYLPVGNLSEHDVSYLAQTLQHVVADSTNPQCASEVKNSSSNRTNRFWKKWRLNPLAFVLIVLDLFVLRGYLIVNFFLRAVPLVASWSLILVVVSIAFTHLLRWCIADFYLESSTAFAKYNSLLRDHTVTDVDNEVSSVEHDKKKSMLDTTVNDSILSKIKAIRLVKDNSKELHDSARALVTGATGFVGSLLLRDILRLRDSLGFSGGVVVLCRKKRGKSASDRIADLLRGDIFSFLSDNEKANLVVTVEGDVTKPKAGLSASDWDFVCRQANISHVFHCAASVSFTLTLLDAAKANITSALTMQALTARMNGRARFVHISTAFVHGGLAGSESSPLPEQLFSLEPFSPTKIYESMLGPLFYASKAMLELRFPNTYTFSKCVCEHLLTHATEVETVIIRPTIVGPAIENPREGWAGDKPQTIVAAASLYLSYQWNLWCFGAHDVPYIPVDVVTRLILAKGLNPLFRFEKDTPSDSETNSSEDDFERISRSSESSTLSEESHQFVHNTSWAAPECAEFKTTFIFNAAWSILSPSSFSWLQYAVAVTQLGSVLGYFAKSSTYLGLFFTAKVQPKLFMTQPKYERLHYILVQFPLQVATRLLAKVGLPSSRLETLAKYIDLPILFFPFMSRSFYFDSDILAPVELQGDRYLFLCAVAAERFLSNQLSKSTNGTASRSPRLRNVPNGVGLVIGGRAQQPRHSDFWTVLTEPRGNYYMRIAVWIFAKILRSTCDEVIIDVSSFSDVALASSHSASPLHVVLAPTHRSLFDTLLLSYALFCVPELQLDTPSVAAADDFLQLPLIGLFARVLNALFLQRGKGQVDPSLHDMLSNMKACKGPRRGTCVEVFIEGTRSRDRRFGAPKTGFLRCLEETGGAHLLVPITINYERLPEQTMFVTEVARGTRFQLSLCGLISWLSDVAQGKVRLGRVLIAAGKPIVMNGTSKNNMSQLTSFIQREQQAKIYASTYHIQAAAALLNNEANNVRTCLKKLGCLEWPYSLSVAPGFEELELPDDSSELLSIMLHFGHLFSPLVISSHPKWAKWLNRAEPDMSGLEIDEPACQDVAKSLSKMFDAADVAVRCAREELAAKGFNLLESKHVLQEAKKRGRNVPVLLLVAAVTLQEDLISDSREVCEALGTKSVSKHDRLGCWGYFDSGFSVQYNRAGKNYVAMSGSRYNLCGKHLTELIPFIEAETQIKIDPNREADYVTLNQSIYLPSELQPCDVDFLTSSGVKFSLSTYDRARSGSGQSQEDVFLLRNNLFFRIPDAVAWPRSEREIVELVELAKQKGLNLIPVGGGTNVTSATRCPSKDVDPRPVISVGMQHMNEVLWINEEDGLAHVEAGITGQALSEALLRRGYTVGHEPDSMEFSTLGGWIATKASGMKKNKYGNIEDIVKSVRVATSRGMAWQGYGDKPSSTVAGRESRGLDLCSMMLGSEGCFGIITSAVLRISPVPEAKDFECVLFTDFACGLRFLRDVAGLGRNIPASVRLLDNSHFRLGQALRPVPSVFKRMATWAYFQLSHGLEESSVVAATIAYEGTLGDVRSQKKAISCLSFRHGGIKLGAKAGRDGYDLTFVIAYLRDFAMSYNFIAESFETFAPWSKIDQIVHLTKTCIQAEHEQRCLPGVPFVGCRVTQIYHEGVCLYFYLCMNTLNVENPSATFAAIERIVRTKILENGGSLTHHHGVGKLRAPFCQAIDSDSFKSIIKSIKVSIDGENTFGAGNGIFSGHSAQLSDMHE